MKFVHAADLHLDSPLRGLERYEGAPLDRLRGATRAALGQLVDLCIDEEVSALLIAGDVFDDDWRDYSTGMFFAAQMSRLRAADIDVVWIRGNHDAASKITKHLRLPENVRELPVRKPGTVLLNRAGLAVHGQGFATRSVTDNLVCNYPAPIDGFVNVGLLHTSVTGRVGHASYAPCRLQDLTAHGYAYWALGHVHAREVLSTDPWVVFPGNLQGRHAKELGPKGATLVHCDDGDVTHAEHRSVDMLRWEHIHLNAGGITHTDDLLHALRESLEKLLTLHEERALATRVTVEGTTETHATLLQDPEKWVQALRATATDLDDGVWLEKILFETRSPVDVEPIAERDDPLGQLIRSLRDTQRDPSSLEELGKELADLERKLPAELRSQFALRDPEKLAKAVAEVEKTLLPRLLEQ